MEKANKTYGFTIAVKELRETVPNIFRYASAYMRVNKIASKGLWEMFTEKPKSKKKKHPFLPKDDPKYKKKLPEEILNTVPGAGSLPPIDPDTMEGESYNMCHFWSNFEIARLDWFRSKEYEDFFQMMDRSGGFWTERVSLTDIYRTEAELTCISGETPPFILWLPAPCSVSRMCITSATLATGIPLFSIARRTRRRDNCLGFHISKRRRLTTRNERKKTTTGKAGTKRRRTVSAADASATPTLLTSRAKRVAAWLNGSKWQAAGRRRR